MLISAGRVLTNDSRVLATSGFLYGVLHFQSNLKLFLGIFHFDRSEIILITATCTSS